MFVIIRRNPTLNGKFGFLKARHPILKEIQRGVHFLDVQLPNKNITKQVLDQIGDLARGRIITADNIDSESIVKFYPTEYIREVLMSCAIRTSTYLSKIKDLVVTIVDPDGIYGAYACDFLGSAQEVRIITLNPGPLYSLSEGCLYKFGQPLMITKEVSALRGSDLILAPSGMKSFVKAGLQDTRQGVVFSPFPNDFEGGMVISSFKPSMGLFSDLCPPDINDIDFSGACFSLCGLRGLCELTPKSLYADEKSISFDDIAKKLGK